MEDYQISFVERNSDTKILHESGRKIGAMHFGGITIECLLKAIIFSTLPNGTAKEWNTKNNDPGHTITNPGHSYMEALKRNNRLSSRVYSFRLVLEWLNQVEHPIGQHFIDIRYSGIEPNDSDYKSWFDKYQRLIGWLQKQSTKL